MATEDKRIQFLKLDGTDLFTQGDVIGATGLYATAMQLQTNLALESISVKDEKVNTLDNDENKEFETARKERTTSSITDNTGINQVLEAVMEQADEAMRVNPTLPKGYMAKATVLLLQNKWDEAREVYNKGIKSCQNCDELRNALRKLYKTQAMLTSIPSIIERTISMSSEVSSEMDGMASPSWKNRRFKLQHRKKLSRPRVQYAMSINSDIFTSKDSDDDNDTKNGSRENLLVDSTIEKE